MAYELLKGGEGVAAKLLLQDHHGISVLQGGSLRAFDDLIKEGIEFKGKDK